MLLGVCEIFSQAATLKLRQSCMLVCLVHELTHLVIVHVQKYLRHECKIAQDQLPSFDTFSSNRVALGDSTILLRDSCVSKTIVFERSVMKMFETVILYHRDVITLSHVVLFIFSDFFLLFGST